jgi:hypothetical protein
MTNEELLQTTLNQTIERMARQSMNYEVEIVNLNSQIAILNDKIKELEAGTKADSKAPPAKS